MTSLDLVDAVVERLQTYLPSLDVRNFPDRPEDFVLTHPKGALLVSYSGSDGDDRGRVRHIDVVAVSRGLRDAWRYVEATRVLLEGWQPTGVCKFICQNDNFLQERSGEWQYGSRYSVSGPAFPVKEADITTRLTSLGIQ